MLIYGVIIAVIVLSTVIALAVHIRLWKGCHYVCPDCSTSFKPTFARSLTAMNAGVMRKMTCPNCGCKKFMAVLEDK
jgi:DNA-directed RNA polymerase subunit RPC12/RpoP